MSTGWWRCSYFTCVPIPPAAPVAKAPKPYISLHVNDIQPAGAKQSRFRTSPKRTLNPKP